MLSYPLLTGPASHFISFTPTKRVRAERDRGIPGDVVTGPPVSSPGDHDDTYRLGAEEESGQRPTAQWGRGGVQGRRGGSPARPQELEREVTDGWRRGRRVFRLGEMNKEGGKGKEEESRSERKGFNGYRQRFARVSS